MVSHTVAELAARLGGDLSGDGSTVICGVARPAEAAAQHIAPVLTATELDAVGRSQAGAFILPASLAHRCHLQRPQLLCQDIRRALGRLLELFAEAPARLSGVHETAVLEATAVVESSAYVGPFCYVGPGAYVGPDCLVDAFCYVGQGSRLERGCRVGPHAVLCAGSQLAQRVIVGPGCVVGSEGFGYWREQQQWHRMPSQGSVRIGSEVELGANTCVDRGTLGPTWVGEGTKIDNLVQVGHNVQIGDGSLLCAQVGLAGSAEVGPNAMLGGQVGIADHVCVGADARVGAGSGVLRHVEPGQTVSGYPALDHRRWLRSSVLFGRLAELQRQLQQLRAQMERLTEQTSDTDSR